MQKPEQNDGQVIFLKSTVNSPWESFQVRTSKRHGGKNPLHNVFANKITVRVSLSTVISFQIKIFFSDFPRANV